MAWCFYKNTRAAVAAVLRMHLWVFSCLWVNRHDGGITWEFILNYYATGAEKPSSTDGNDHIVVLYMRRSLTRGEHFLKTCQRNWVMCVFRWDIRKNFPEADWLWDHDDVIKWEHFLRYRPFVRGIHRSPVNSPRKGQWRGALMFSLIRAWTNGWVNNRDTGDLRHHRAHYDVTVMWTPLAWSMAHTRVSW